MKLEHRILLKKAWYLIRKDCDHNVSNQPLGTMCACAHLLITSGLTKVPLIKNGDSNG